jgi:hypothetical protein
MAKIQQGFTVNGTDTTVITTQPGAIWQFTFANGNCSLVPGKAPVELFTTNGTINVNLNNLQNPFSNSTLSSNSSNNQRTITGNSSERINVLMENVTTTVSGNTTLIGRIAYYVDDEGTKLNLNAATGDRTTINVGSSRSLSLSTMASANQSANFTLAINGNSSSTSSIQTWGYFFRPEQVAGLFGGNALITGNLSKFSATPVQVDPAMVGTNSTSRDYHIKRTPWGTPRLFINDLPTDPANATAQPSPTNTPLSDSNRSQRISCK